MPTEGLRLLKPTKEMPFSIMLCAHGCERKMEMGPRLKANWAWCAVCQRPICRKPLCMSRCPTLGWLVRWDQSEYKDWVAEKIQEDPDAKLEVIL